jgi:predicted RNA binding protein YcfA (HicA-like mRNA interferase family)
MPTFPGVNHLRAVRALERAGFRVARQSGDIVMTDGSRVVTIPRHNPVNAITMSKIIRDAGLSHDAFEALLR